LRGRLYSGRIVLEGPCGLLLKGIETSRVPQDSHFSNLHDLWECLNKWVNEIDEMKSIVWKLTAFELAMVVAINE